MSLMVTNSKCITISRISKKRTTLYATNHYTKLNYGVARYTNQCAEDWKFFFQSNIVLVHTCCYQSPKAHSNDLLHMVLAILAYAIQIELNLYKYIISQQHDRRSCCSINLRNGQESRWNRRHTTKLTTTRYMGC